MAKWKDFPENPAAPLRASVDISEKYYQLQMNHNQARFTEEVRAQLDSRMADALADMALDRFCRRVGLPSSELSDFLRFLWNEPDLRERYIASVAARRIIGDPLKAKDR